MCHCTPCSTDPSHLYLTNEQNPHIYILPTHPLWLDVQVRDLQAQSRQASPQQPAIHNSSQVSSTRQEPFRADLEAACTDLPPLPHLPELPLQVCLFPS